MGKGIDNKELFKAWLSKQYKQDGSVYSSNTIKSYCFALSKSPEKLEGIDDCYKQSIFVYNDVTEFSILRKKIEQTPNFDIINQDAGNQAFKYGMIKYEDFLRQKSQGDTTMPDNTLLTKCKALLESTRNLILTGAPGTGKTHLAKQIAEAMGCKPDEIGFVQFHPSYDYTDFVEGLRPVQSELGDGSQIGFERKDGVFKEFCGRALRKSFYEIDGNIDNFEECWKKLVDELNENNFIVVPLLSGKDKFRIELNEYGTGLANRTYENDDYQKGNWIQGKSKFFSKEQLYNVYQGLPGIPSGGHDNYRKAVIKYMKENFGLLEYKKSETTRQTKRNFVFIIDEINRGEVAKIFGELFYAIDPGYRGEKGLISTQYQNLVNGGEWRNGFFVPENVYIIGTMNDIDRGVESMDFAFRRRFAWAEVKAAETQYMLDKLDESRSGLAKEAKDCMDRLNEAISKTEGFGPAYEIGASYFLKLNQYDGDFDQLWDYHLKGILEEYLRGNPRKEEMMADFKKAYDGAAEQ